MTQRQRKGFPHGAQRTNRLTLSDFQSVFQLLFKIWSLCTMDSENSKGWPHFFAWSSCSLFLLLPGDELMFSCSGWTLLQISGSNTGSAAALKCLAVSKYPLRKAVSTPSFAATLLEVHRSQKLKMFSDYKQQHWKVSRTDKLSFHYMKLLKLRFWISLLHLQ